MMIMKIKKALMMILGSLQIVWCCGCANIDLGQEEPSAKNIEDWRSLPENEHRSKIVPMISKTVVLPEIKRDQEKTKK